MNIKVWNDKYVIKDDAHCYVLKEIKTKQPKDGEEEIDEKIVANADGTYEITVGYPTTVAHAFSIIVEREGRKNRCTTMDGYIRHLKEINAQLEENIKAFSAIVGGPERVADVMTRIASAK